MARIRTVKPEFFTSLTVAGLSVEARLTFIGLWTHVDDQGRCVDDPRLIKAAVWPLDDRISADIERDLKELTESSLILRYKVGERSYLCVRAWDEHQRINRPTKSKLPPPPESPEPPPSSRNASWRPAETPASEPEGKLAASESVRAHTQLTEGSLAERKGTGNREQGREHPPTPRRPPEPPADRDLGEPSQTELLVAEWINSCNRRPSRHVINDVGRLVAEMLQDDIPAADIARGIEIWQAKGSNPRTLPSFVNQVMNARPANVLALPERRPSTTDQRVGAALELAAKYAQEDLA
jgi:hypothetical protein